MPISSSLSVGMMPENVAEHAYTRKNAWPGLQA